MQITDERVIATLKEVVAERPDYVYTTPEGVSRYTCKYVHMTSDGGKVPGCLAGTVFHRIGVSLDELEEREGASAYDVGLDVVPDVSNVALMVLDFAQDAQDGGATWSEALRSALARMEER